MVQRGELQALVLDTSYLNYKEAAICNASTVGGQFHMVGHHHTHTHTHLFS